MKKHLTSLISIILLIFVSQISFGRSEDEVQYAPGKVEKVLKSVEIPAGSYMKVYFDVKYMGPVVVGSYNFTPDYARILFPNGTTILFTEAPEMQFINELLKSVDGIKLVSTDIALAAGNTGTRLITEYLLVKE